jgi:hypothetical protein
MTIRNLDHVFKPKSVVLIGEVRASTALPGYPPEAMFDRDFGAIWKSEALPQTQSLILGFRTGTEYGGLHIEWDEMDYACGYQVEGSDDGRDWIGLYAVTVGAGGGTMSPSPMGDPAISGSGSSGAAGERATGSVT